MRATGYDRHIEVRWDPAAGEGLARYVIYRSFDGKGYMPIGIQLAGTNRYADFLGKAGVTAYYKVTASDQNYWQSSQSAAVSATTREMSDDELLTMLQDACFRYYWDGADPASGSIGSKSGTRPRESARNNSPKLTSRAGSRQTMCGWA